MLLALSLLVAFRATVIQPALQICHLLREIALHHLKLAREFALQLVQLALILILNHLSSGRELGFGSFLAGSVGGFALFPLLLVFGLGCSQIGVAALNQQAMGFLTRSFRCRQRRREIGVGFRNGLLKFGHAEQRLLPSERPRDLPGSDRSDRRNPECGHNDRYPLGAARE